MLSFLYKTKNNIKNIYTTEKKWFFLSILLVFSAFWLGLLTYISVSNKPNLNQPDVSKFGLLYANILVLIVIFSHLVWRWITITRKRKGFPTAFKLQKQIVLLFSLVTIIPGVSVAIFASLFFNLGVKAWFGEPVKNALFESNQIVEAYLKEHKKNLGFEAQKVASLIQPKLEGLMNDRDGFDSLLTELEDQLYFNEAIVIDRKLRILGKSLLTFSLELASISPKDFKKANTLGSITLIQQDQLRSLVPLDEHEGIYLYVGKKIDKNILNHLKHHKDALSLYDNLQEQRSGFEITFLILFALITVILLLSAIWFGINLTNRLVTPVSKLVDAAQTVSDGNLDVYVEQQSLNNELDVLVSSFNTMTNQIKKQQNEIIISEKKAAWSDIARKIAHEIKNPLTPIQLSAERLKRRYSKKITEDDKVFSQCIDTIIRQVNHIELLVREFSNFARMPEAKIELCNIIGILNNVVQFETQAHQNITIIQNSSCDSFTFACDPQQISQVFMNLLQNSINVLDENNIPNSTIKINFFEDESQFFITFSDNGPGFPKIGREKLCEPYYTTREKGTGLGLAIVEKIVNEHGGVINFSDSNIGGALVTLVFEKIDKMSYDILIIDDEKDIREQISGILEDEGFETRAGANSIQAFEEIRKRRPHLIILDVWLGNDQDGLHILQKVKENHHDIPIIMISGHATISTAVEAIKNGAYDFIEKPFQVDKLLITIQRAIETSHLKRENAHLKMFEEKNLNLIGNSSTANLLREKIQKASSNHWRVFISGSTGSGKEVLAKEIHDHSSRKTALSLLLIAHTYIQMSLKKSSLGLK